MALNLSKDFPNNEESKLIYLDDDRHIFISISAFGELRRDLINNLGIERMKGFLIRYGWELGRKDGKRVKEKKLQNVKEMIRYGPLLHTMKGHVIAKITHLQVDESQESPFIKMEGLWKSSYEANEHVRLFGVADHPVCYTLTGYASGYISELFNESVIFKEVTCEGMGEEKCHWIGKPLAAWGKEIQNEMLFYQEAPIVQELEETYEKLLKERNNLAKTAKIHKKLTEEIISGNDLFSLSNVVYKTIGVPLLIEDAQFRTIAASASLKKEEQTIKDAFITYLDDKKHLTHIQSDCKYRPFYETKLVHLNNHQRLITPIFLQGKIFGYCSLIYATETNTCSEIAHMIIERISSVCSLYLLNEKSKFETSERMKGQFLEELINGQFVSVKDVLKRGNYLQLNLDQPFYVAVLKYKVSESNVEDEITFHEMVLEQVGKYFQDQKMNILVGQRLNNIILLIPEEVLKNSSIEILFSNIHHYLHELFPHSSFRAGVSMKGMEINQISDRYQQALTAVRMTISKKKLITFQSLGIVGSLINDNNKEAVIRNAQYLLEPIYEQMSDKRKDALKTLYVFLANGGNLEQTAMDLSLSVSGLRYRIRKIEEVLQKDLRDPVEHHQLLLSLQALILTGELHLE